jgi:hypothetical protein
MKELFTFPKIFQIFAKTSLAIQAQNPKRLLAKISQFQSQSPFGRMATTRANYSKFKYKVSVCDFKFKRL